MTTDAKIIKDSISPFGVRLTTFEVVMHRFVLAEFNTHRQFSRNSASSRAIPLRREKDRRGMLDRFEDDPAFPLEWPHEQAGMQGGGPLEGQALLDAKALFEAWHSITTDLVQQYLDAHPEPETRLHKSLTNRLLEPMMWHTVVVTSSEWANFFHQRSSEFSPMAQPEIREAADLMLACYRESTPEPVGLGEWHLPYIDQEDWDDIALIDLSDADALAMLKKVSVARCARVSYLTHDGQRDLAIDVDLFEKLVSAKPMHASPLEHVATPSTLSEATTGFTQGNFYGWHQLRHDIQTLYPDALGGLGDG